MQIHKKMIIIGSNKIIAMTNNEVEKIKFFDLFFSFYLVKIHKNKGINYTKYIDNVFINCAFVLRQNMLR